MRQCGIIKVGTGLGDTMKKLTRRQFTAAGILAALGAAAAFIPSCNTPVDLYGPPPDDYDPDENELETVYGPPEDYEPDDSQESGSTSSESTTFDPAENELVDVYGPPEDVDPDDNILINDYGQSEDD